MNIAFWNTFLKSNETKYRLLRTIAQGVIGVLVAYIDVIIGVLAIPNELRPMIVALIMAVLSPLMSELGKNKEEEPEYGGEVQTAFNDEGEDMFEVMDNEDQDDTTEE